MGEFADGVRDRLRDALAERRPSLDWETEYRLRRTPVDVVGRDSDRFVALELEWRRADPANNTAKLFYHLSEGDLDDFSEVVVCQVFTGYYDLESGGYSSKREVAAFVGETAADAFERVSFYPVTLPLDPPKHGGARPEKWRRVTDETAADIDSFL